MPQGDDAWFKARCGKLTGSRMRDVLDRHKRTRAPNKARRELLETVVREIRTGVVERIEPNEYMLHGTKLEPQARAMFEFMEDAEVEVPDFIEHPTVPYVGYSPDGLIVGADEIIEIKCPFFEHRHERTVESQKCPDDYYAQCQAGLWVTGRSLCKFISFYPPRPLVIVPVPRDDAFINMLAEECSAFWREVQDRLGD